MKLRARFGWIMGALMLATLSCQVVLGLDEPVESNAPAEAGVVEAGVDARSCGTVQIPARPAPAGEAADGPDIWFAATGLELPITNPDLPSGIDLDDTCTTCGASGEPAVSCKGPAGNPRCDLANGVDDSLGKLTTTLGALNAATKEVSPVEVANEAVITGQRTLLLYLTRWNRTANDSDVGVAFVDTRGLYDGRGCPGDEGKPDAGRKVYLDNPLPGQAPDGGKRYSPSFDGCDRWSTTQTLSGYPNPVLLNDNVKEAYVSNGKLVQKFEDVALPLFGRRTSIRDGYLIVNLLPAISSTTAFQMQGTLSGRVAFEDIARAVGSSQFGQGFSDGGYSGVCENDIWGVALPILCSARDIMARPDDDSKGLDCNGLTIALGFYAKQALVSEIIHDPPPVPKDCKIDCPKP